MLSVGRSKLARTAWKASISLRPLYSSSLSSASAPSRYVPRPRRTISIDANARRDLFEYTSGRWVYNDALRRRERRLAFDVDGLCRLVAESVGRSPTDVVNMSKLAEGGFNRTFLITLRDGFQMVARIPYPVTSPKFYSVASEVATLEFLRASGLPVPEIYGYSPDSDNAIGTEYILMQFVRGSKLSDVWPSLSDQEVISVVRQLTELESRMMSLSFPAGGSLYFTKDLKRVAPEVSIPLDDERFCVGPDTRLPLWYGKRSKLEVNRGPYLCANDALQAGARKELAYLQQFNQPLLPFRRERRAGYQYQEQSPSAHIENVNRYLLIASSLVPKDPNLSRFCIRHPDLQHSNIIVERSPDSVCKVIGLLDWQHASILPMFLAAGVPQRLQNYDDPVSQAMKPPSLPEDFKELDEAERMRAEEIFRDRLVHYHYVKSTEECNKLHYAAFTDPAYALRGRLFEHASSPWEGETFELELALIQAAEKWEALTGGGKPCPIGLDADSVRKTRELNEVQAKADRIFDMWQNLVGLGEEGWVVPEDYEDAVAFFRARKEEALADARSAEEVAEIMDHWLWDDMDEEKYM